MKTWLLSSGSVPSADRRAETVDSAWKRHFSTQRPRAPMVSDSTCLSTTPIPKGEASDMVRRSCQAAWE
jgi:hypothetical protein